MTTTDTPHTAHRLVPATLASACETHFMRGGQPSGCARLKLVFDQAPNLLAIVSGPQARFELANRAFCEFFGHAAPQGQPLAEVLPELCEDGRGPWLQAVMAAPQASSLGRTPERFSVRIQRPGQCGERVLELVLQPVVEASGEVSGLLIEGVDITAHARTEADLLEGQRQALRAVECTETERSRLDALLEAAPVGIIMADVQGRLLRINAENRRIWGQHPLSESHSEYGEWKGWWADGGPRHGQRLAAHEWALARALRGEECPRDIVEIESFGDVPVRRTIVNSGAPVRDAEGRIIGAVIAQMDITDRVRAEQAAVENEAKFRTITEAMPQMVWSTLPDGRHDYFNHQWYEFTGVQPGQTDGDGWLAMFHPDDQARTQARWLHSLRTGAPYDIEYRLRHRSGQYRWTLGRALPVRDERGELVRWMGTCTDIHEQKMAQEALLLSDRRKNEFLAMLAHELRNPLAPITAAAELLSRGKGGAAEGQQLSQVILRHAAHMSLLVDDLLDVSRVTRGLVSLVKTPVDLRACLQEALEQVRPLISARAHRLHTRMDLGSATLVMGEKKRLVQVLSNLLSNAAKYTPRGGLIEVDLQVQSGQIELAVRDNGIGMSPELVARAFDLFAQGERSSDRSEGGLGIGLALVRTLVQLHDGRVWASSSGPGQGSVFTVALPQLAASALPAPLASPAAPPLLAGQHREASAEAEGALRILVVDDNLDAGHLLGMFLQTLGHEVRVEGQSHQALALAASFRPQVCLLDIGLPEMDGYELARRIRLLPGLEAVRLAAVTGYSQARDRQAALDAGFDQYFVKPLDVNQLEAWLVQSGCALPV